MSITIDRLRKTRLDQLERAGSHGENAGYSLKDSCDRYAYDRYAYEEARKAARHGLLVLAIDDVLEPSLQFRYVVLVAGRAYRQTRVRGHSGG